MVNTFQFDHSDHDNEDIDESIFEDEFVKVCFENPKNCHTYEFKGKVKGAYPSEYENVNTTYIIEYLKPTGQYRHTSTNKYDLVCVSTGGFHPLIRALGPITIYGSNKCIGHKSQLLPYSNDDE